MISLQELLLRDLIKRTVRQIKEEKPGGGLTDFGALYRIEKNSAIAKAKKALIAAGGDIEKAAHSLEIAPTTLRYYLDLQPSLEKTQKSAENNKNENRKARRDSFLFENEAAGPDPDYARKIVEKLAKAGEDGVGMLTRPYDMGGITIILYKTNVLVGNILASLNTETGTGGDTKMIAEATHNAILGLITLDEPEQPCNDALVVKYIFSREGYGPTLYAIAMQLSPSGRIMSDRHAVSDFATNVYKVMHRRSDITKIPLDDYRHSPSAEHDEKHTEDPRDDCEVWYDKLPEKEFLDYTLEGGNIDLMTLKSNHKEAMKMLNHYITDYLGWNQATVENYISNVADFLFVQAYQQIPVEKRGLKLA